MLTLTLCTTCRDKLEGGGISLRTVREVNPLGAKERCAECGKKQWCGGYRVEWKRRGADGR